MVLFLSVFLSACDNDDKDSPPAELTQIQITSDVSGLPAGLTTQLSAAGYYADGSTSDLTYQALWTSEPQGLVTVNYGLVRGDSPGDVVISAAFEGI